MTERALRFLRVEDDQLLRSVLDVRFSVDREAKRRTGRVEDPHDFSANVVHVAALLRRQVVGGLRGHICRGPDAISPTAEIFEEEVEWLLHCVSAMDHSRLFCAQLDRELSRKVRLGLVVHALACGRERGLDAVIAAVRSGSISPYRQELGFRPIAKRRSLRFPRDRPQVLMFGSTARCAELSHLSALG
ncbi:N-acyl amino acid synthase FeeM domain-containing protein [Limimaricola pyoseonensis]|uniref:N-acyl amino acid synthase FeeM catalytic core domain-containing protein n=1 Tax=Limimaricola pyoseonensis TaxID=521013 RepID=A0A1G7B3Z2_9RHOB|nr:hypothetical protein [Limimaricola pyoseonensis]SDE21567.1 hypothetical protein SAMN04488567_1235 [Limimaricola pyoseonensis]